MTIYISTNNHGLSLLIFQTLLLFISNSIDSLFSITHKLDPCESRDTSTPKRFPSYLLLILLLNFLFHLSPSPVHPTRFSFCFFPGFLAIFACCHRTTTNAVFMGVFNVTWRHFNRFGVVMGTPRNVFPFLFDFFSVPLWIERFETAWKLLFVLRKKIISVWCQNWKGI